MIEKIVCAILMTGLVLCAGCEESQDADKQDATPASIRQDEPEQPKQDQDIDAEIAGETEAEADNPIEENTQAKDENMQDKKEGQPAVEPPADGKLYAVMETSMGVVTIELFEDDAPETVENFVGLATGTKPYRDPKTGEEKTGKFYDGLAFHRVIPLFMIQGGCPLGSGMGGPGYKFKDEFVDHLVFDTPGILAMANSGPRTNGSQFFITVAPTPHLNNKHTIFGKVVDGYAVVLAISNVKQDRRNKPLDPVVIRHLTIERQPE